MNSTSIKSIGIACAFFAATASIHAQTPAPAETTRVNTGGQTEIIGIESEPGLAAFLEAYIAANNARDVEKIKAMMRPEDLAAWKAFMERQPAAPGQTKPAFEKTLLRKPIPKNHPPFVVLRFLKGSPLPQAGVVDWPVAPTHEVQCTYETSPGDTATVLLELAHADGRWFVLHGVPNAEFVKR